MASVPEVTVASLEALLRERNDTIKEKKIKVKDSIRRLKADHIEVLKLEQAENQQLQEELESMEASVFNLEKENAALIKRLETLQESSADNETKFNVRLLEAQKEHECAFKIQQDELNEVKCVVEKLFVEKYETYYTIRSLEERLAQAESVDSEEKNRNNDIEISKLPADSPHMRKVNEMKNQISHLQASTNQLTKELAITTAKTEDITELAFLKSTIESLLLEKSKSEKTLNSLQEQLILARAKPIATEEKHNQSQPTTHITRVRWQNGVPIQGNK